MSAAQLDELPPENNGNEAKQTGSLVPALVAIILSSRDYRGVLCIS